MDCSITYHASPDPGTILVVEGKTLSNNRRTAAYLFNVYMEKEGARTLVATMKSVSYRTGRPIDPGIGQCSMWLIRIVTAIYIIDFPKQKRQIMPDE